MYGAVPGMPLDGPTTDVSDWSEVRDALASRHLLKQDLVVATVSWIGAGKVEYALRGEISVLCVSGDPREFAFLRDVHRFTGHGAVIVANAARADWRQNGTTSLQHID